MHKPNLSTEGLPGVSDSYFSVACDPSQKCTSTHKCVCVPECVTGRFTCSNDEGSGLGQGLSAPLMREGLPAAQGWSKELERDMNGGWGS